MSPHDMKKNKSVPDPVQQWLCDSNITKTNRCNVIKEDGTRCCNFNKSGHLTCHAHDKNKTIQVPITDSNPISTETINDNLVYKKLNALTLESLKGGTHK